MEQRQLRALLLLTFVTGVVDAASFLGLGQVFCAMQTGNVIFLGFGIAGSAGAAVTAPLVGLGAFLAGGAVAAVAVRAEAARPGRELRLAIAVEVALLGAAAALAALADPSPGLFSAYVLIAILSFAMGLRNTVVRRLGDPNLATTVLNLTLTAAASPLPAGIASGAELGERWAGLAAILLGAVAGALLVRSGVAVAIAVAAAIALLAALSCRPRSRFGNSP